MELLALIITVTVWLLKHGSTAVVDIMLDKLATVLSVFMFLGSIGGVHG